MVFAKHFKNGAIRLTHKESGKAHPLIPYTEERKIQLRQYKRIRMLRYQYESMCWTHCITLTLGRVDDRKDAAKVMELAKKFLKSQNVDFFIVAQTYDEKEGYGEDEFHVHGVTTGEINLMEWQALTDCTLEAQYCELVRGEDGLDMWFHYITRKLFEDSTLTKTRLTASTCEPQSKCTPKTEYFKSTEEVKKLVTNRTVRGEEAVLLEKELERIKREYEQAKSVAEKGANTKRSEKGVEEKFTTSRILYRAREGGIVNLKDYVFESGGAPIGRRHNRKIPVFCLGGCICVS
ncbi:MAG: hypothetical protein IJ794_02220 [Lachnospiraceae bacterium]|nr:hypothetical protein [Lachnospiraceae bacterium]